jgi:hypothetical protein
MQRHQRRLDRKDQHQQHRAGAQKRRVLGRHLGDADRHIGHVQRAGDRIKHPQRRQKQRRAGKVIGDILHARAQPHLAAAMDHQPVAGDQQHLEEHEQVEGVAGQEGAADAHQLELPQRMEMPALAVPARADGIKLHHQRQHRRQQHHQRRQPVQHQHDAEGRGQLPSR